MSDATTARREIDEKYTERQRNGLDLGAREGDLQDIDHGGWLQVYERGRIYWHRATGANEIHGGILQAYLERGGPDRHPETGRRELKVPTSDEHRTFDGRFPVSTFEEGAIYWLRGRGGVALYGAVYDAYRDLDGAAGRLGYPVTDPTEVDGFEVAYFEGGCLWREAGKDDHHRLWYFDGMPMLGRPAMFDRSNPETLTLESVVRSDVSWDDQRRTGEADRVDAPVPVPPDEDGPIPPPHRRMRMDDELPDVERSGGANQTGDGPSADSPSSPETDAVDEELHEFVQDAGESLWAGRLVLRRVGPDEGDPIALDVSIGPDYHTGSTIRRTTATLNLTPEDPDDLTDSQLYDVWMERPEGDHFRVLPHAVYATDDWTDFAFAHATDLHVSERVDGFRQTLLDADRRGAAQELVNFNDSVRQFVRYANRRHQAGELDLILATGDLIDYVFEASHHRNGGGNFEFLAEILLGRDRSADPRSPDPEELRVPIFTVLGNHDYVLNDYELFADVGNVYTLRKYSNFNLTEGDAKALQGGEKRDVSIGRGQEMLRSVDVPNDYYTRYVNDRLSYVVELGDHRLVGLETGPNKDVIGGVGDAIQEFFGFSNENEQTFVEGTPNTDGLEEIGLYGLADALEEAGDDGRVIVGMHAPPMNPWADEFPHYFRETERPGIGDAEIDWLVDAYFSRQFFVPVDVDGPALPGQGFPGADPDGLTLDFDGMEDWLRTGTPHFKTGGIDDRFDLGIARDNVEAFLRLCAGRDPGGDGPLGHLSVDRAVDIVLFGHVHRNVEFRVEGAGDGFRFFQDFYTENPTTYYPSYDYFRYRIGGGLPLHAGDRRPVHLRIDPNADAGADPTEVTDVPARGYAPSRELAVPPYADPLDAADDATDWWQRHRPLFAQTACLGPLDRNQRRQPGNDPSRPSTAFQGFRVVTFGGNDVQRVETVRLADEEFRATVRERLEDKPREHHEGRANRGRSVGGEGPIETGRGETTPDQPPPKRRDHRTGPTAPGGTGRRSRDDTGTGPRVRRHRSRSEDTDEEGGGDGRGRRRRRR